MQNQYPAAVRQSLVVQRSGEDGGEHFAAVRGQKTAFQASAGRDDQRFAARGDHLQCAVWAVGRELSGGGGDRLGQVDQRFALQQRFDVETAGRNPVRHAHSDPVEQPELREVFRDVGILPPEPVGVIRRLRNPVDLRRHGQRPFGGERLHVAAQVEERGDPVRQLQDRVVGRGEGAELAAVPGRVDLPAPLVGAEFKAEDAAPVLHRGQRAHHGAALRALVVRHAEVEFRQHERLAEDPRRPGLQRHRETGGDHAAVVVLERHPEHVSREGRVVEVGVIVHIIVPAAGQGGRVHRRAGEIRERRFDADSAQSALHLVEDGALLVEQKAQPLLRRRPLLRRQAVLFAPRPVGAGHVGLLNRIPVRVFVFVMVQQQRILVDDADRNQRRVVVHAHAGVGIDRQKEVAGELHEVLPELRIEHHLGLDFEHALEWTGEAAGPHGVEIERQVNAALLQFGEQKVHPVEHGRVDLRPGRIRLDQETVEMVETDRVVAAGGDPVCQFDAVGVFEHVALLADADPQEADGASGTPLELEVLAVDDGPAVFAGRSVEQPREVKRAAPDRVLVEGELPVVSGIQCKRPLLIVLDGRERNSLVRDQRRAGHQPDRIVRTGQFHGPDRFALKPEPAQVHADDRARVLPLKHDCGVDGSGRFPPVADVAAVDDFEIGSGAVGVGDFDRAGRLAVAPGGGVEQIEPRIFSAVSRNHGFFEELRPGRVAEREHGFPAVLRRIEHPDRHIAEGLQSERHDGEIVVRPLVGPAALPVVFDRIGEAHVGCGGEIQRSCRVRQERDIEFGIDPAVPDRQRQPEIAGPVAVFADHGAGRKAAEPKGAEAERDINLFDRMPGRTVPDPAAVLFRRDNLLIPVADLAVADRHPDFPAEERRVGPDRPEEFPELLRRLGRDGDVQFRGVFPRRLHGKRVVAEYAGFRLPEASGAKQRGRRGAVDDIGVEVGNVRKIDFHPVVGSDEPAGVELSGDSGLAVVDVDPGLVVQAHHRVDDFVRGGSRRGAERGRGECQNQFFQHG